MLGEGLAFSGLDAFAASVPIGWSDGLDLPAILAGQGIDAAGCARLPAIRSAARRALEEGLALLAPAVANRLVEVERADPGAIVLAGGLSISGEGPSHALVRSRQVLLAVCTVGERCHRRSAELLALDPARALAFDGLATAAVHALVAAVCARSRAAAAERGDRTAAPVSPGQGGWDLADGQRLIFGLVDPSRIGVRLSDTGQMQPVKSASFAIGIGPTVSERSLAPCAECASREGCRYKALHRG
jgi:hypothetical protein